MKLKMPNLQRKKIKPKPKFIYLFAVILMFGLLLSGCSLFSSSEPSVVGSPPTRVPATATIETSPTQEQAVTETQEPVPATQTAEPTPEPILQADTLPDPNLYNWTLFASGLDRPVFLTHAGDQSGRVFVVEKTGRIQIFQDGTALSEPFLDIVQLVNSRDSERGLLGLAFHPKYAENGLFYVNYTNLNGDTVVARYQVSADKDRADANSQQVLLTVAQPYPNHNGGMIAFGPDGYLYVGMGDGGSGGDPQGNAQNPNTLLGKILRIDVDGGTPYSIPAGNAPGGLAEIWALGLRNPWRFSFDRLTGDLLIGDVGQNQWEEIDILPGGILGGSNLGWDYYEGTHTYEGNPPAGTSLIFPVIEYPHNGGKCSVTGGYTYRGTQFPDWQGVYLYGDYCAGLVWGAIPDANGNWQTAELFKVQAALASFGEDESGELYLLDLNGSIYKLGKK
jgi:glucose/arabinose dehydrogenase